MKIHVICGSILEVAAEVIVNPANSQGVMGGGVAGVIRRVAGADVEKEAMAQAPIPVGTAVVTTGGKTKFKAIIHAPTMTHPAETIPVENVRLATRAALALADQRGWKSVALPGMGTGVGRVSPNDAAKAMLDAVNAFQPKSLREIILIDVNAEMISAWQSSLSMSHAS